MWKNLQGWNPVLKLSRICEILLALNIIPVRGKIDQNCKLSFNMVQQHSPNCSVLIANIHDMFNLFYTFTNKGLEILQETQHK